jgi:hypothetical protein
MQEKYGTDARLVKIPLGDTRR